MKFLKQYSLYLIRWQLSSPILAIVLITLSNYNQWIGTIIANLLGGLIFFWIDKYIFKNEIGFPIWEIQETIRCIDCGQLTRGYRLVKTKNYDHSKDQSPEFRCEKCSQKKLNRLKKKGVIL